jgi:hypothetical protein
MAKKDEREYGYEGEMVMTQLKGIIRHSKQMYDMLEPDTDLPEWVQSKITLAFDYIQTATDYITTEMNEEAEMRFCPKCNKAETRDECAIGESYWDKNSIRINEEAPANAVGDGSGIKGIRPDSIGVGRQAMSKYKRDNAAAAPKAGRKTLAMFMQGTK